MSIYCAVAIVLSIISIILSIISIAITFSKKSKAAKFEDVPVPKEKWLQILGPRMQTEKEDL